MKKLLATLALACMSASCVATSGDLADLSGKWAETFEKLQEDLDEAAETGADTSEAFEDALAELGEAVDETVETIEGRVQEVTATVAAVGEKVGEGPLGWMELLMGAAGTTLAGVGGLHAHRNSTRRRDLQAVKPG